MFSKLLDSRLIVLYILPFIFGLLTVLSFQPFNFSFVNFIVLSAIFLLTVNVKKRSKSKYRKKPFIKNLFIIGYIFAF